MSKLFKKYLYRTPLAIQLFWFCFIGTCAAITHLSTVILLVELTRLSPLVANIGGFAVSFNVSYWGHRKRTFAGTQAAHKHAIPKLFLVSSCIFIANEFLFYLLLKHTRLPYFVSLTFVIILLAVITFLLSKVWVFRHGINLNSE